MIYRKHSPSNEIGHLIECYWWIDSEGDSSISEEKIIPDGFPEMIWHYGEPYEINLSGHWEVQPKALLAGQLTNHFFLAIQEVQAWLASNGNRKHYSNFTSSICPNW